MFFFCPQKSVFLDGYRKETRRGSLGLLPASIRKKRRHSTYTHIYCAVCEAIDFRSSNVAGRRRRRVEWSVGKDLKELGENWTQLGALCTSTQHQQGQGV